MTSDRPIDSGNPKPETTQHLAELDKRGQAAARHILAARDPFGSESIDHALIERLLVEAYRCGWEDAGAAEETGTDTYRRLITIPSAKDLMREAWSPTPWIINVYTDRVMSDDYCRMRQWCIDHFGQEADPLQGIDGTWQMGTATVHGWTLYGFADRGLMERFITAWPRVSTWLETG